MAIDSSNNRFYCLPFLLYTDVQISISRMVLNGSNCFNVTNALLAPTPQIFQSYLAACIYVYSRSEDKWGGNLTKLKPNEEIIVKSIKFASSPCETDGGFCRRHKAMNCPV